MKANRAASSIFCSALFAFVSSTVATPELNRHPGSYRDWNDIDEVTIVQPFQFAAYNQVVITPLDIREVKLPPSDENTYPLAKEVLSTSAQLFAQGIREKLTGTAVQVTQGSANGPALVVRARLNKLDPGSKAARMWAPGAGAAQASISGEILDARTKKVLIRFTQERRAVARAIWQPESILLSRTIKQIAGDVVKLLKAF